MRQEVRNPPSSPPSSPFSSPVKHWSPQWNVAARNRSSPACCRVQISVCPWSHWHVAQLSLVCVPDVRPPLCRLCFRRPCPAYRLCVSLQVDLVCRTATVTQLQPARTANPIPQKHHAHLLSLDRIPRVFLLGPSGIHLHRVYHKPVMGSVAENTLDKISDFWNLMIVVKNYRQNYQDFRGLCSGSHPGHKPLDLFIGFANKCKMRCVWRKKTAASSSSGQNWLLRLLPAKWQAVISVCSEPFIDSVLCVSTSVMRQLPSLGVWPDVWASVRRCTKLQPSRLRGWFNKKVWWLHSDWLDIIWAIKAKNSSRPFRNASANATDPLLILQVKVVKCFN